ncbi:LacI family DNA-binding transcriptional regulator [Spelaeicoccus albus]|uniref:LacI family transcriptional regulator n=1 Tax=Spelaeicoccus albus TaxID=1280376 RepID=A0A7Z0II87_9MICO|nr:LacI family DNA-binding transcriptional regulator [Spelaeicoccus albus]NYI68224.1 LacI family transcriptional regulator [Spelaeicoccus albus]
MSPPIDDEPGAPTLAEVAKLAGVSLKTASRAVNGERYVSSATMDKVLHAAAMLGFRPNRLARELRQGSRSSLIGMVVGDLSNPFYARVAGALEKEVGSRGFHLITASTGEDPEAEQRLVEELLERRVAALVLVSTSRSHRYLAAADLRGTPIVFLDRPPVGLLADTVLLDNRAGARMAVEHLISHGHRQIGLIGDLAHISTHQERLRGYVDALTASGIDGWEAYVREDAHDIRTAKNITAAMLAQGRPPTAIFTANSRITIGALNAMNRLHRAPALIGFDDFELSEVLEVSVVAHDMERMGAEGAALVLARLAGGAEETRRVTIPCRIVARGSGEREPRWR